MANTGERAQEFASPATGKAQEAWDTTRQQVQQWGERAQDFASDLADRAPEALNTVSDFFRRYPVPMFFGGIALGFLLSRAFGNWEADMTSRMSNYSQR